MEETGYVSEVKNGRIIVEIARKSACSRCGLCSISGETGKMVVELDNTISALKGDKVRLYLKGRTVLQASLIIFALPLVFFLAGVFLGSAYSKGSGAFAAAAGLFGLTFGFFAAKIIESKIKNSRFLDIKAQKI